MIGFTIADPLEAGRTICSFIIHIYLCFVIIYLSVRFFHQLRQNWRVGLVVWSWQQGFLFVFLFNSCYHILKRNQI